MKKLIHTIKLELQTRLNGSSTRKRVVFFSLLFAFSPINAQERTYEVPPSSTKTGIIPAITDTAMKECVELYNEASWLKEELNKTQVNLSSPASVDAYNSKASHYSRMADYFNNKCAGKQSKFVDKVAQKLNQMNNE